MLVVRSMVRFWIYIRKNWKAYLWTLLALIAVDGLQLVLPLVFGYFIDAVTRGAPELYRYGLVFLGLAVGIVLLRYFYRYEMGKLALFFDNQMRDQFFTEVMGLPLGYLQKEDIGDIMARATNDMQAIRQFLIFGMIGLTDIIVLGISTVTLMVTLNGQLFLASVGPIALIAVITLFFTRYVFLFFERVQDIFGKLTEKAQEFISGIRVLRAFARETRVMQLFGQTNQEYYKANMKLVRLEGIFDPSMGFLITVSTILAIWFGVLQMQRGELSLGLLVAFTNYIGMLSWPMMALGFTTTIFQRSRASMRRVEEIFHAQKEQRSLLPMQSAPSRFESVEAINLALVLEDRKILERVCFRLEGGSSLGVVGPIGAGKTMLFRLLLRFIEPEEGRIFLNGTDIRYVPMEELRRFFAYVPQDSYLFSATLLENIRYSRPEASRQEVEEAVRVACLEEEIGQFGDGLDTLVGERGVTLSGGQRQRVAIARALISRRPVLLLDDALSAVDTHTEETLIGNLKRTIREQGISVISISHRVSTLLWTDTILVLRGGRVTETGAPTDLLKQEGYFAHLYQAQILEGTSHAGP